MKKFTFKGVLDGFRSTVQASARPEQEIQETLRSSDFTLKKVSFSQIKIVFLFNLYWCFFIFLRVLIADNKMIHLSSSQIKN